jgi:hypothetical protein
MSALMLGLASLALWTIPTADDSLDGRATYYAEGMMEQVAANRGLDLRGYKGGVALNRAGDLRRTVWLQWADGAVEGPFLVVDCASRRDFPERERQGYVVEVDAQTARRRVFYDGKPAAVTVWFRRPESRDLWTGIAQEVRA